MMAILPDILVLLAHVYGRIVVAVIWVAVCVSFAYGVYRVVRAWWEM